MIFAIYARSGSSAVNARSLQIAPADSRNCNLWSRSFTCSFFCFARARYATMSPWHELAAERRERERERESKCASRDSLEAICW